MSKKTISDRLKALAADDKNRSKAARLLEIHDDIENALLAGVSHSAVLEILNEEGFELTLGSFRNALHRIRKKRAGKPIKGLPAPQAKTTPLAVSSSLDNSAEEQVLKKGSQKTVASHDPKDIDQIMSDTPDLEALAKATRS